MPKVTVSTPLLPTEERAKVERAILSIFPDAVIEERPGSIIGTTESLERFMQIIRIHKILDSTRSKMFKGMDGNTVILRLNKQVASTGKVSFSEGTSPLGDLDVTIVDDTMEELIEKVAPRTVEGEEIR